MIDLTSTLPAPPQRAPNGSRPSREDLSEEEAPPFGHYLAESFADEPDSAQSGLSEHNPQEETDEEALLQDRSTGAPAVSSLPQGESAQAAPGGTVAVIAPLPADAPPEAAGQTTGTTALPAPESAAAAPNAAKAETLPAPQTSQPPVSPPATASPPDSETAASVPQAGDTAPPSAQADSLTVPLPATATAAHGEVSPPAAPVPDSAAGDTPGLASGETFPDSPAPAAAESPTASVPVAAAENAPALLAEEIEPDDAAPSEPPPISPPQAEDGSSFVPVEAAAESGKGDAGTGSPVFSFKTDAEADAATPPAPAFEPLGQAPPPTSPETPTASSTGEGTPLPRYMQPATLAENLDRVVLHSVRADPHSIRIEMEPASLGRVLIQCRETSEGLSVDIQVQHTGIRTLLASEEHALRESLESQGHHLGRFSVSCRDGEGRSDEGAGNHPHPENSDVPDRSRQGQAQMNAPGQGPGRTPRMSGRNRWVA